MKTCHHCHRKFPDGMILCPYCDQLSKKRRAKLIDDDQPITPAEIRDYKTNWSYLDPQRPYVYAYFLNYHQPSVGPDSLADCETRYLYFSIESAGILFLDLNAKEHFTGQNTYIGFAHLRDIKLQAHQDHYHVTVKTAHGKIKLFVPKVREHHPEQQPGVDSLVRSIDQYHRQHQS